MKWSKTKGFIRTLGAEQQGFGCPSDHSGIASGRIIGKFMRGPENMASDSEPRKFLFEAPSKPRQKSHFGKQKAVRLLMNE